MSNGKESITISCIGHDELCDQWKKMCNSKVNPLQNLKGDGELEGSKNGVANFQFQKLSEEFDKTKEYGNYNNYFLRPREERKR